MAATLKKMTTGSPTAGSPTATGPTRPKPFSREPKILLWDIETDGIMADRVICIGFKWYGQKRVHLLKAEDYERDGLWDDSGLIAAFSKVFAEADYHATWYGARFDLPVVNARIIAGGLLPLPPIPHLDLWRTARYQFKTGGGNRLAKWQDFLGLPDEKTIVKPSIWIKARYGHQPSLEYIYQHCKKDVLVLEGVFERLRPWVRDEPQRRMFRPETHREACPKCGSLHTKRQGYKLTRTRRYQQWQCQSCGTWYRSRLSEKTPDLTVVGP